MESDDQTLVQRISEERVSGKTTLLKELRWGLANVPNLKVLFVCPVFKLESSEKYRWLPPPKCMNRATVFLKYKPSLCKTIIERPKNNPLWLTLEGMDSVGEEFVNCPYARNP